MTSLQAHFLATIVTLYNLYETRSESISLSRLVQDASEDLRSELRPMLNEANSIWRKKITVLRNDVYAHLSDTDVLAKYSDAALSPNEIERLIDLSKQLVNKLSYANDRGAFAFNLDSACDTYNVLDRLPEGGN